MLGVASAIAVFALAPLVHGNHPGKVFGPSVASAYVSLAWLSATLILAPLRLMRSGALVPRHVDLRRDLGIWAGLMALIHVVFGLQGHMQGRFWEYFVVRADGAWVPRIDLFGLSNYLGLGATLIVIGLLLISNDYSIRRLGGPRWKACQRTTYGFAALTLIHGVLFQRMGKRPAVWVAYLFGSFLVWLALQGAGMWRHRTLSRF